MQVTKYILILLFFISLMSCGKESLNPSDYVAWVNDETNGLLKKKEIFPLSVELLYKPIPYIIANEQRKNNILSNVYNTRAKELEEMQYYTLKLSIVGEGRDITTYNLEDNAQQQDRLSYLSFAMQKDIKLIESGDTLSCKLFHFERSYDLAKHRTFVLGFEQDKERITADKTIILDLPYFKTGPIKLTYKTSDLERIPNLKL